MDGEKKGKKKREKYNLLIGNNSLTFAFSTQTKFLYDASIVRCGFQSTTSDQLQMKQGFRANKCDVRYIDKGLEGS